MRRFDALILPIWSSWYFSHLALQFVLHTLARNIHPKPWDKNPNIFEFKWFFFIWICKNIHVLGSDCGGFDRHYGDWINVVCNSNKMGFHKIGWRFIHWIFNVCCCWHRCLLHSGPLFNTDPGLHRSRFVFHSFNS